MREALENAIKNALCIEFWLPDVTTGIDKTSITTINDMCLKNTDIEELSKIIYNGLVEYSLNEYKIDYQNLELEQMKVLSRRIKYDHDATDLTKSKYGFYGEILLDLILRTFVNTKVLLARGYLYSPLEDAEVKGFDAFHLLEYDNHVELWLGEAKFYQNYAQPIQDVLKKISYALSDKYVNKNFLTVMNYEDKFSHSNSRIANIFSRWEQNPKISIAEEIANENMIITYPIMIAYQTVGNGTYEDAVKKCVEYIETQIKKINIHIAPSFTYKIFFIFLPVDDVKTVKERVYRWIDSKEPLI